MTEIRLNALESSSPRTMRRAGGGIRAELVFFEIASEERAASKKTLPVRELRVLLVRRAEETGRKRWALPGGYCEANESCRSRALREFRERTGLADVPVEFFNAYDEPGRDTGGGYLSHAFLALSDDVGARIRPLAGETGDVRLMAVADALALPLDREQRTILDDALESVRRQMLTTTIARRFLPEEFTISELYQVIETVVPGFEDKNFIRKLTSTQSRKGILEEARDRNGERKKSNRHSQRSAQLYRFTDFEPKLSVYG